MITYRLITPYMFIEREIGQLELALDSRHLAPTKSAAFNGANVTDRVKLPRSQFENVMDWRTLIPPFQMLNGLSINRVLMPFYGSATS